MAKYNLTERQKRTIRIIVENLQSGNIDEPVVVSCAGNSCDILGIEHVFESSLLGDMDALADEGMLLIVSRNNFSGHYMVKQSAYDATANDFEAPDNSINLPLYIGAIVQQMTGGNLQAVGFSSQSEIRQVVNDPQLLHESMKMLTDVLVQEFKSDLSVDNLRAYLQAVEELNTEVAADNPSPTALKRLISALAFMGDIEGSIALSARALPHILPIISLIAEKIGG
jgi:hypothetical protein